MSCESLGAEHFARLYAHNPDPWSFETSVYEHAKYEATLAALGRSRFARGLEIGCSIGVLTQRLATRCGELLAVDVIPSALEQARRRCARWPHVTFARMQIPEQLPEGHFDLILLSEVGYYWSRADLAIAADALLARLRPGASLLLVHWTPFVAEHPLTGDEVHDFFLALTRDPCSRLRHRHGGRAAQYRLDLFVADPARA